MKTLKLNDKRNTLIACFIIYIIVNAILVICNYGAYSTDEFYSLGSANLAIETTYNQAPYINALVRGLSRTFGSSYYVFKMIPMTAGFVSYCCAMYLVIKLTKKPTTVVITSLAITFNALVMFNHLYIRNYVFAEAAYMLSMVFLYKYSAQKDNKVVRYGYLLLFVIPNGIYYYFTNDSSGGALLALTVAVLLVIVLQNYLDKIFRNKVFWVFTFLILGAIECLAILLKKQMIDYTSYGILDNIHSVISFYQTDIFVFVLYLMFAYLAVTVSIVIVIVNSFRLHFKNKEILLLTVYTIIPMIAYFMFMFNNSMLRCYASYVPAGFVIMAYVIDTSEKKIFKTVLVVLVGVNTIFTYYPFPNGIIEFWRDPMIRKEVYIRDYQDWIDEAKTAAEDGYTIVPMMTLLSEEYYFDFDTVESLTLLDEDNQTRFTDEEIVAEFDRLMNSGDKYAVLIDTLGRDALIRVGLYDVLKDKYQYTLYYDKWYDDGRSIIYIE
jgi:hypothetical protein